MLFPCHRVRPKWFFHRKPVLGSVMLFSELMACPWEPAGVVHLTSVAGTRLSYSGSLSTPGPESTGSGRLVLHPLLRRPHFFKDSVRFVQQSLSGMVNHREVEFM